MATYTRPPLMAIPSWTMAEGKSMHARRLPVGGIQHMDKACGNKRILLQRVAPEDAARIGLAGCRARAGRIRSKNRPVAGSALVRIDLAEGFALLEFAGLLERLLWRWRVNRREGIQPPDTAPRVAASAPLLRLIDQPMRHDVAG